jgi:hypothetical protein
MGTIVYHVKNEEVFFNTSFLINPDDLEKIVLYADETIRADKKMRKIDKKSMIHDLCLIDDNDQWAYACNIMVGSHLLFLKDKIKKIKKDGSIIKVQKASGVYFEFQINDNHFSLVENESDAQNEKENIERLNYELFTIQ